MPDNTPDSLAMYVVAMHRAYDCPEVVAAPSGADRDAAERRRAVP